jgi:hypothetical protein
MPISVRSRVPQESCATTTSVTARHFSFSMARGAATGWRNFRGVLPAFAKQFRCLILEFPGFGVSDDFGGHPM